MSKIVLDVIISKELKQNDVIRFNKEKNSWENVSYACFNKELYSEVKNLNKQIEQLNKSIDDLKDDINKKLELYHKSLQILLKR